MRGFTRHRSSGVTACEARYLRRIDRKGSLPQRFGYHRRRAFAGFPVRSSGCAGGPRELLGLPAGLILRAASCVQFAKGPLGVLDEFRDMVKALHRAGIEVILDVVFNHTTEGGHNGPTLCYRGLANDFYYILENDKSRYADYTGCGNTLNANQPIVRRLIQDSLRYWVTQMHIDGFRFDLALHPVTRRGRPPAAEPAGPLGYRVRILCWRAPS